MKSQRTKARILSSALKLFNERGTAAVTTHDIAAAARMSPGNLYYHYRDKGQIVRALFDDIDIYKREGWRIERFDEFVKFFFASVREHRFFFMEFSRLAREDAELAALWRARQKRLASALREAAARWVKAGLMRPFEDAQELECFADNAWVLCHFAAAYMEVAQRTHAESERLLLSFLRPYHTPAGLKALSLWST